MDTNLLFGHLKCLFIQVSLNRVHLIVSFLDLYMNIEWMEETSSSRFWISFLYSGWFGIITILVIRITNKINCNEKIIFLDREKYYIMINVDLFINNGI